MRNVIHRIRSLCGPLIERDGRILRLRPGVLVDAHLFEELAMKAGLTPEAAFDVTWSFAFADHETMTRALIAPAGLALLVGAEREPEFKRALIEGLAAYRTADGGYRLSNQYHYLITHA